jgi:hypothetical protein
VSNVHLTLPANDTAGLLGVAIIAVIIGGAVLLAGVVWQAVSALVIGALVLLPGVVGICTLSGDYSTAKDAREAAFRTGVEAQLHLTINGKQSDTISSVLRDDSPAADAPVDMDMVIGDEPVTCGVTVTDHGDGSNDYSLLILCPGHDLPVGPVPTR